MKIYDSVKDYYGKILKSNEDLQSNACCTADQMPKAHRDILAKIAPEVNDTYYGCGLPIPPALNGITILDLGSGSGRDAFLLSALVGETGHVIGIDMTEEQLAIANKYRHTQAEAFDFTTPNTEFRHGYIEDLKAAGIADNSIDVVVSNCVINLSPDKERVFKEIFRVLKPGGEMYISDVFADRRVPESLQKDPVLFGECISGALYIEDFRRLCAQSGCADYRVVSTRPLIINNPELKEKMGDIQLNSITVRAFKLPLEDICEDYGQSAVFKGGLEECAAAFVLDEHYTFKKGEAVSVCGNTADMLAATRYTDYFAITGDKSVHYGMFASNSTTSNTSHSTASSACC